MKNQQFFVIFVCVLSTHCGSERYESKQTTASVEPYLGFNQNIPTWIENGDMAKDIYQEFVRELDITKQNKISVYDVFCMAWTRTRRSDDGYVYNTCQFKVQNKNANYQFSLYQASKKLSHLLAELLENAGVEQQDPVKVFRNPKNSNIKETVKNHQQASNNSLIGVRTVKKIILENQSDLSDDNLEAIVTLKY